MTKLEQKLLELGYVEAEYHNDKPRIYYFKNKYGCFDFVIILSKDRTKITYSDIYSPKEDTPFLWLSKLRICQNELQKDLEVLKDGTQE